MFNIFKTEEPVEEVEFMETDDEKLYKQITSTGFGMGGLGMKNFPQDKTNLKMGWCCPKCDRSYSPSVKQCRNCNESKF